MASFSSKKHDAEWLTEKQRAWMQLVTDFQGTLYECARIGGYNDPAQAVKHALKNPYIVGAILRRYHRRMLQIVRVLRCSSRLTHVVERPKRRIYVPVGSEVAKAALGKQVAGGKGEGSADSILGEEKA